MYIEGLLLKPKVYNHLRLNSLILDSEYHNYYCNCLDRSHCSENSLSLKRDEARLYMAEKVTTLCGYIVVF